MLGVTRYNDNNSIPHLSGDKPFEGNSSQQTIDFRHPQNVAAVAPSAVRTRNELQSEAVKTLIHSQRLIVEWGTGVGKSRVAILTSDILNKSGISRILLLVAETAHKENWKREFIEALGEERGTELFNTITVECYASLPKYIWTNWQYIICDEAHHLRSDNRTAILATMYSKYILCLSATLSEGYDGEKLIQTLEETFGDFETISFGLQDAINSGILCEPKILVHVLPIDEISELQTINVTWGFTKFAKEIDCNWERYQYFFDNRSQYPNMKLNVTCTAKQAYDTLTYFVDECKKKYTDAEQKANQKSGMDRENALQKLEYVKNEWMQYGSRRKLLLGRCKSLFAESLIKRNLQNKKFVCFCSDVKQGERLGGNRIISAQRRDNAKVIEQFNNGESNSLYAVGMIQEGANLTGIEAGVVIQLGGKERVFIQKFGRAMRSKCPEQHLIVINGTRDVDYLHKALDNINPKYVSYKRYGRK